MINPYYKIPYEVREALNPREQLRRFKWARQRVSRGWADRDTWGGGEYIMRVTAGILRELNSDKNPIDWDQYWIVNFPTIKKYGYKNLGDPAKAIETYLEFYENKEWTDHLDFELKWFTIDGEQEKYTKEQDKQITAAIKIHRIQGNKLYKEAQQAMHFVADNINGLWW